MPKFTDLFTRVSRVVTMATTNYWDSDLELSIIEQHAVHDASARSRTVPVE